MKTFTMWLEARGQYAIKHRAIDGSSTKRFSSLPAVAQYIKQWDMGTDYRRPWGLQDEYGQLHFVGFTWNDIMDGSPYENGKYKFGIDPIATPQDDDNYPDYPDEESLKFNPRSSYGSSGEDPPF